MAEGQPNDTSTAPKLPKKTLLMIIGAGVVLILLTAATTFFAIKHFTPEKKADDFVSGLSPAIYKTLSPNFTVNFNVDGRQRFLQAEINLMYRDPSLDPLLTLHMPAIRNGIVMILSQQDFGLLHTAQGKDALRKDILVAISEILRKEHALQMSSGAKSVTPADIEQVLFTNFVMQ